MTSATIRLFLLRGDAKSLGIASANSQARSKIEEAWGSESGRISIVSGKDLLSTLSHWCQQHFGIGFGSVAIAHEIKREELDPEIVQLLTAIENSRLLPNSSATVQQSLGVGRATTR